MIAGVNVLEIPVPEDDRGALIKVIQHYQLPGGYSQKRVAPTEYEAADQKPGKFGEVYVVHNPAAGTVRAFHKHFSLWDYFAIVHGSAKFCLVDDRLNGVDVEKYHGVRSVLRDYDRANVPTPGETQIVVTSGRRPKVIVVPPGIFHGWVSLEPDTILVSIGTDLYNPLKMDEVRVPPEYFNDEFGGDPWEVKGR